MRLRTALLAAAALAGLAACGSQASAGRGAAGPRLTPASTQGAPFTGVYETNSPGSFGLVRGFAAATGARPSVVLSYSGWGGPFDIALADDEHAIGATPLVQIDPEGPSVESIARGRSDAWLRSYAGQVEAFGHPVILSFGHEMNGRWYPWGEGRTRPAVFVAAWRHVVNLFRERGAANVTWLWTVNAVNATAAPLRQWWPGADYVNWVGIDGYFYFPSDTFSWVFGRTVAEIRGFTDAPVLIAETGVGPNPDAARQVRGLFAGVKADHMLGLVWFDRSQDDPPYHLAWRLETDPAALAAFRAAVAQESPVTAPLPQALFEEIYRQVPRLTVEVIVRDGRGVFLTRRASGPCAGLWHIPGGTVRFAEPLGDAVRRVAMAELGIVVTGAVQAGAVEYPSHYLKGLDHPVGVAFEVVWSGEPRALEGADAGGWFAVLPEGMHGEQAALLGSLAAGAGALG